MKKIYYLSTCDTCKRIMKAIEVDETWVKQDIKTEKITELQLDEMKALSGSFEALFSRRAQKYKALGLKELTLSEDDYKNYILKEYTFLKRPVTIIDNQIFVGNSKKVTEAVIQALK